MDANRNKLNLGCGKMTKPADEGWWNVDKFDMPNVDQQIDLFRYPWAMPDNQFDEVYASHIIEHIPHEAKASELALSDRYGEQGGMLVSVARADYRWSQLKDLDGFFAFFAELHRVCKPDAIVNIICPFGYTRGAFQDPTHTRYIVPPTFDYLTSRENGNWDYHLPLKYAMLDVTMVIIDSDMLELNKVHPEEIKYRLEHEWDVAYNLNATLQVVK